jgi:hypothetical protein
MTQMDVDWQHMGVLPVTIDLLEQLFCLPDGYKIVACSYNLADRLIYFTLVSDALPLLQDSGVIPHLQLHFTVETLPDQSPEYRKITTEVKMP